MHFPKNILLISLFVWLSSVSFYSRSTTTIYKLQIGAFEQNFDRALFDDIKDLGILWYDHSDKNFTKVQLGTYMDRSTALRVQEIVKSRGYNESFLVSYNYLLEGPNGEALTHTLQFSATKKLNVRSLVSRLSADGMGQAIINDLCITYKDGLYRLSMGFIAADNTAKIDNYKVTMNQMGYSKTILQNFRPISDNSPEIAVAVPVKPVAKARVATPKRTSSTRTKTSATKSSSRVKKATASSTKSTSKPKTKSSKKVVKKETKPSIDAATLYDQKCALCHGKDGKLGLAGAADLSMSVLSTQQKVNMITKGQGAMPSFAGQLSEAEIKAIVKEVNKLKK